MNNDDTLFENWCQRDTDLQSRFNSIMVRMLNADRTNLREACLQTQRLMAGIIEDLDKSTPLQPTTANRGDE